MHITFHIAHSSFQREENIQIKLIEMYNKEYVQSGKVKVKKKSKMCDVQKKQPGGDFDPIRAAGS